jgi:hypothetical protein
MIIAFPAGGTIDTLGRIAAQKLWKPGARTVVENRAAQRQYRRPGRRAGARRFSLHLGAQTLAVNVTLAPTKGFDPTKDLEPIMLVATAQDVMMVPPDSPFRSARELIDYAKANPGQLNYASLGTGTSGHLASTLFSDLAGVKLQHVPYSQYSQALISGPHRAVDHHAGRAIGNIRPARCAARCCGSSPVPTFKSWASASQLSWYALPSLSTSGDHRQQQRRHGPRHRAADVKERKRPWAIGSSAARPTLDAFSRARSPSGPRWRRARR